MTSRRAFLRALFASSAAIVVAPTWVLAEVHRSVPVPAPWINPFAQMATLPRRPDAYIFTQVMREISEEQTRFLNHLEAEMLL